MNYLALGDSISIDDYTGVPEGGAVRQFARLIGATQVADWTQDGCTTAGVLQTLQLVSLSPDIVTLTAGGNDFLQGAFDLLSRSGRPQPESWDHIASLTLENLRHITARLAEFRCAVILNTIYDPTDGDDALASEYGLSAEARQTYDALNTGIKDLARQHGFLCADLETLFSGHGIRSRETWITQMIEPNYAGATAIARHWFALCRDADRHI